MTKMKTINDVKSTAIYLRRSQGEDYSELEKHLFGCTSLCEKRGWSYVVYKEIESGDSIAGRPVMQELLDDVSDGLYDAVVVTYYDRLGRGSGTDQDIIFSTFLNSDTLIIETTPFNVYNMEDDASEEQIAFKQFMARRDYKMITKRMNHGRKMALEMGRWIYRAPYGYSYDSSIKKLVINEEQSKVCRMIIDMYLTERYSTNDIAWELNKLKIPSPKGTLWNPTSVLHILKSETLLGHMIYNKTQGNRDSKSVVAKKFKRNPKSEWKVVKNTHPAIKTDDEHDRILQIIKNNRKRKYISGNEVNILTGLVKCYNCDSTLVICKNLEGEDVISKCKKCKEGKGGHSELVMDTIYITLDSLLAELKNIEDNMVNSYEKQTLLKEIEKYEKKLELEYKKRERIEHGYEYGFYTVEQTNEKLKETDAAIYEYQDILNRKSKQFQSFKMSTNAERMKRIEDVISEMKKNKGDSRQQNIILKSIINSIVWKRDKWDEVEVTVNFL